MNNNDVKKGFTDAEKALLCGLSKKIGSKHRCSGMYVRHIINGKRNANSPLAQKIVKDLHILLEFLQPEA